MPESTLPKGAEAVRIALSTPTPKGYWGVPVLLWGPPGVGKSSFIERFHREDFPVLTMIASLHDPTDFNGLPMLSDGRMEFAPPSWVRTFEEAQRGILFLDELTTAPPAVQAALLRLVLERKVGQYSLPPEVRIVAAANPKEFTGGVWDLTPPLANRFVHIQWVSNGIDETEETSEEISDLKAIYVNALRNEYHFGTDEDYQLYEIDKARHEECSQIWRNRVADFLSKSTASVISKPRPDEYSYATPRTWDFAIALMATCDICGMAPEPGNPNSELHPTFTSLLKGAVGGVAFEFLVHLVRPQVNPREVLEGRNPPDDLRGDEAFVLISAMAQNLKNCQDDLLLRYAKRFCEVARNFIQRYGADIVAPAFRQTIRAGIRNRLPKGSDAYECYSTLSSEL